MVSNGLVMVFFWCFIWGHRLRHGKISVRKLGFQRCPAHQETIDVVAETELKGVLGVCRATVLDPDLRGTVLAKMRPEKSGTRAPHGGVPPFLGKRANISTLRFCCRFFRLVEFTDWFVSVFSIFSAYTHIIQTAKKKGTKAGKERYVVREYVARRSARPFECHS